MSLYLVQSWGFYVLLSNHFLKSEDVASVDTFIGSNLHGTSRNFLST